MSSPSGADRSGKTRSDPTSPATELPGPIRLLQRRQRVAAIDEDDALHLLSRAAISGWCPERIGFESPVPCLAHSRLIRYNESHEVSGFSIDGIERWKRREETMDCLTTLLILAVAGWVGLMFVMLIFYSIDRMRALNTTVRLAASMPLTRLEEPKNRHPRMDWYAGSHQNHRFVVHLHVTIGTSSGAHLAPYRLRGKGTGRLWHPSEHQPAALHQKLRDRLRVAPSISTAQCLLPGGSSGVPAQGLPSGLP